MPYLLPNEHANIMEQIEKMEREMKIVQRVVSRAADHVIAKSNGLQTVDSDEEIVQLLDYVVLGKFAELRNENLSNLREEA